MENKEQKTNPFLKGLKAFGHYLKFVVVDFFTSFKYNNMKLPAILIAIPGILIGFFLIFHIPTIRKVIPNYTRDIPGSNADGTIALDKEADGTIYYKLTISSGLKYDNVEYKNVVLNRKVEAAKEGTKLPTPTLEEVTFESGKIGFTVSDPDSSIASQIDTYNVFVFKTVDGNDYVIQTNKKVAYGTAIDLADYTNDTYKVAVQAVPAASNETYVASELSTKASFTSSEKKASYNEDNYALLKYAGLYEATSGLDDKLKTYELQVNADGTAKVIMNGTESTAKFGSSAGTTSFNLIATETVNILPFNYTGMVLFGLMLMGILNIFFALSVSGKKNLGSVVKAIVTTAVMIVFAVLYIYAIFATEGLLKSGEIQISVTSIIDSDTIMSILFIIVSIITSIAGCVLGLIYYDRNYEKVTF